MQYIPRNTTAKPITMEVVGIIVPAKSRFNRPLTWDELQRVNTCGVNYEGIVLEPVVSEADASAPAKPEAGSSGPVSNNFEESAASRRGRRKAIEVE